jgi:hypothetical protein
MAQTQQNGGGSTLGTAGAAAIDEKKMVSHWKSMSSTVNDDNMAKHGSKSEKPAWCLPREAYTSKRCHFTTENSVSFGTYGHNPRNKLNQESDKMTNEQHDLTMGSTKVTNHIPGYNGFIPKTDLNPNAIAQGKCD